MNDREKVISAAAHAQLAFLFLYFNINIGTVSILPAFAGWLIFVAVIDRLKDIREDVKLLRPFAYAMALWELALWICSFWGYDLEEELIVPSAIMMIITIYFIFQIMTDFAAIAEMYDGQHLVGSFKRWRSIQIVLQTIMMLMILAKEFITEEYMIVFFAVAVLFFLTCICLMILLGDLKRWLKNPFVAEEQREDRRNVKCLYESDL